MTDPGVCARLVMVLQENWSGGVPARLPDGAPVCGPEAGAP
jgi:hypothetical protein